MNRKRLVVATVISILHFAASCICAAWISGLVVEAVEGVDHNPSLIDTFFGVAGAILMFPIGWIFGLDIGREFQILLLLVGNSILWGVCLSWLIFYWRKRKSQITTACT